MTGSQKMLTGTQAGTRRDVIVVGAGHNGPTAGAMLARAGLSTLLLAGVGAMRSRLRRSIA